MIVIVKSRKKSRRVQVTLNLRLRDNYCFKCRWLVPTYEVKGWRFHTYCKHLRCARCGCAVGPEVFDYLRSVANLRPPPLVSDDVIYLDDDDEALVIDEE